MRQKSVFLFKLNFQASFSFHYLENLKYSHVNYVIMIASTQITNNEIFAFVTVLVLKLLSRKVLIINRKKNRNC